MSETAPVKATIGSAIAILTLVRVRVPVLFPFSPLLTGNMTRTK